MEERWEVIIQYHGELAQLAAAVGAEAEDLGDGFAILTLPRGEIDRLHTLPQVEFVELPKTLVPLLRQSLRAACIAPAHPPGPWGLTGAGTAVGILDTGIDFTHPDFRNPDGSSRVLALWDRTAEGTPPAGFLRGAEFTAADLNAALDSAAPFLRVPSRDTVGHGTAVAGIAAGNGRQSGGVETGAAPGASLLVVKLGTEGPRGFSRTTEVMRGMHYLVTKAAALGLPLSVNLSFGTNDGPHDGTALFETYLDAASARWKTVLTVAAGNEGAAGHHASVTLTEGAARELDFAVAERTEQLFLAGWHSAVDGLRFTLTLPGGGTTGELSPTGGGWSGAPDGVPVRVVFGPPTHYRARREVYFLIGGEGGPPLPRGIWRLGVRGVSVTDGRLDVWLPTLEEVGAGVAFTVPDAEGTVTLPATARRAIAVGGYHSGIGAAAQFSGRGFVRPGFGQTPDLVAPAVGILTTRAGGGYDSFTGTSMAAPFVAGAAALLLEWGVVRGNDPFLYGLKAAAALLRGAARTAGLSYPNPVWGYGRLCLEQTLRHLAAGE